MEIEQSNASLTPGPIKPYNFVDQYRKVFWVIGILGGLFMQLVAGSIYQWGMVNIYITSYYRTFQPSLTLQSNAIVFPATMLATALTLRVGLYLSELTHPLIVLFTNQILMALVVFIASFMKDMTLFVLFYAILFGALSGIGYMIPIVQCNKFYPGCKMYVNGIVLIGTGIGSVVFGMFSYNFLNPNKLKPIHGYYQGSLNLIQISERVPQLLKWLSLIYLLIGLLGNLMLVPTCIDNRKRLKEGLQSKEQNQHYLHEAVEQRYLPLNSADTIVDGFKSLVFWKKILIVFLISCGPFLINGNYKTYVKYTINDDQFLTLIGIMGGIANGCSRFLWNIFFQKTGYKTVMLTLLTIQIIVFSTIHLTKQVKVGYLIEVFLANICIGGIFGISPSFSQIVFGHKTGSNLHSFVFISISASNFLAYGFVKGLSRSFGLDNVIYIVLGMSIACVPLIIFTKFQGNWYNSTVQLEYSISHQLKQSEKRQAFRTRQTSLQGEAFNFKELMKKDQKSNNLRQQDKINQNMDVKQTVVEVKNGKTREIAIFPQRQSTSEEKVPQKVKINPKQNNIQTSNQETNARLIIDTKQQKSQE